MMPLPDNSATQSKPVTDPATATASASPAATVSASRAATITLPTAGGAVGPVLTNRLQAPFQLVYVLIRKIVVLIVGVVVLLAGLVMIIAPGPALLVIPLGLGILATEFPVAGRWLKSLQSVAVAVWHRLCHWFPILRRIPFLYQQPVVKRLSDHRPPPVAQ